ncbi:acyl-CoA dehydrogenase family protein [Mycolicibacterium fluoranthenivorans]|uniref:Acyl-CoA dehydrogenase, C-terminal domain n=1 Tax=Mycolicibacterium fluoranthenivorans TaxID=258505 RepID=A0A1G4V2I1_9MYCO|nr:acyl-CoA dehydrogenase family protein [Mycolicibacterium fluoranthenivorans]SCX00181.1 Acyl-CoA dehydrogenase, C-terminal domain [Mycolicibacterium fluoranthenivorans]
MNIDLSPEANEYGAEARKAFEAAGGDELLQRAEADPGTRDTVVAPVLDGLGAWELEPRTDPDSAEASAALCRSAGYWGLPYPVAERLARPADADGLLVVTEHAPAGTLAGIAGTWATVTATGRRGRVTGTSEDRAGFVTSLQVSALDGDGTADLALAVTLPCWTLLGMLDRALELTIAHVQLRQQFGQPLSAFQGVQFQLTDAEVERGGLEMLARYALWSGELADALALRLAALEAADVVFRVTHQLHGAVGFCDETTLSWLSRYSQPLRRLPWGLSATRELLADAVEAHGLTGLYSA